MFLYFSNLQHIDLTIKQFKPYFFPYDIKISTGRKCQISFINLANNSLEKNYPQKDTLEIKINIARPFLKGDYLPIG